MILLALYQRGLNYVRGIQAERYSRRHDQPQERAKWQQADQEFLQQEEARFYREVPAKRQEQVTAFMVALERYNPELYQELHRFQCALGLMAERWFSASFPELTSRLQAAPKAHERPQEDPDYTRHVHHVISYQLVSALYNQIMSFEAPEQRNHSNLFPLALVQRLARDDKACLWLLRFHIAYNSLLHGPTADRAQLIDPKCPANIRLLDRMFWACGSCRPTIQATLTRREQFSA